MKQSAPQSVLPQSANEFAKHHATALKRNDWGTIAVLASDWCTVKAASAKGEAQPLNAAMLVSQVQRIASLQSSDVWRAVAEIVRTRTQGWAWDKYIKTLLRTCVEDQVKLENWKQVSALLRNMITIGVKARGSALERVRNVSSGKAEDVVIAESKVAFHFLKVVSLLRRETRLKPSDCPRAAARFAMTLPEHMSLDELLEALCKFLATNINRNWQDAAGDLDYFVMKRFLPVKYVDHCEILRNNVTARNKKPAPRLALWAWEFIQEQQDFLQGLLDHALTREDRCRYDYFALQTFRKQYSLKVRDPVYDARLKRKNEGVPFELPEHVFMREAMETTKKEIEARHGGADALQDATRRVQTTFEALAAHKYTHASPTMFNSCTPRNQTASCFLFKISQDSISGIYDILKRCAEVSQCGGGLGICVQPVRNTGSEISSGGVSNGLIPMLRNFNDTVTYVSQGSSRRGSGAIMVAIYNKDLKSFLDMRKPVGAEENRCRDLFSGIFMNSLFVQRCKENGVWTLFCVTDTPDLDHLSGPEFDERYTAYEADYQRYGGVQVRAQEIASWIQASQDETGTPYILGTQWCAKSQHAGLFGPETGVHQTSNLCVEIMQFAGMNTDDHRVYIEDEAERAAAMAPGSGVSPQESHTAVCNLATVKLDKYLKPTFAHLDHGPNDSVPPPDSAADNVFSDTALYFDFASFGQVVRLVTRNTDATINSMFYPTDCTRRMNLSCRPIGVGVQALADVFVKLGWPFCAPEAVELGADISAALYYYALLESNELAKAHGTYPRYALSPSATEGHHFQFDLLGRCSDAMAHADRGKGVNGRITRAMWQALRQSIDEHGLRNSLLVAHPPTASTSQILGSIEAFEPLYALVGARKTSAGIFAIILRYLHDVLEKFGLLCKEAIDLITFDGNLDRIPLPQKVKDVLKTAFDMKMKDYLQHSIFRQWYTDQSMSENVFFREPSLKMTIALWAFSDKNQRKTWSYYVRRRPKVETRKFAGISVNEADVIARALAQRARQFELQMADSMFTVDVQDGEEDVSGGEEEEGEDETETGGNESDDAGSTEGGCSVPSNGEEGDDENDAAVIDDIGRGAKEEGEEAEEWKTGAEGEEGSVQFASIDTAKFNFNFELPEEDKCVSCGS